MGWLRRQWWYLTLPRSVPSALAQPIDSTVGEPERQRALAALARFDSADTAEREREWQEFPPGADAMPLFLEAFPRMRRMEARTSMLYEATFFARVSEAAFRLGVLGCRDRSKYVRDRACGVLAYSLRRDALPALRPLLRDPDEFTREAAENTVRAIKHQNHSLYWGGPPGQTHWVVNRGDDPDFPHMGRDVEAS